MAWPKKSADAGHPLRLATPTQVCFQCGKEKPSTEFRFCRSAQNGLDPTCRACRKAKVDQRKDGLHKCKTCNRWMPEENFQRRYSANRDKVYVTAPCHECRKATRRERYATDEQVRDKCRQHSSARTERLRAERAANPKPRKARKCDLSHPARLATSEKECRRCGEPRPSTEFWLAANSKDGLGATCRRCRATGFNPEKSGLHKCLACNQWLPRDRFYERADPVSGKCSVSSPCKACYQKRAKAYVKSRPELQRWKKMYALQWQRLNPEKVKAAQQRRRARREEVASTLTLHQWQEILEVFDHRCAYCLCKATSLEQDHVIAISRGGGHTEDNVVPACRSCNATKSNRPVFVMAGTGLV